MLLCMKVTLLYSVGLIPRLGAQQDGIYSTSGSWAKIGIRGLLPPLLAQFPGGGGSKVGILMQHTIGDGVGVGVGCSRVMKRELAGI